MTPRDFSLDAWELARQTNSPGCVALIRQAMEFGYGLGISDATKELEKLKGEIKMERIVGNRPQ